MKRVYTVSAIKELLQNAGDAKPKKLLFFDKRNQSHQIHFEHLLGVGLPLDAVGYQLKEVTPQRALYLFRGFTPHR